MMAKKNPCSVQRCKRRVAAAGLCNTHLLQKADKAFSKFIRERDGKCVKCGKVNVPLQCMHVVSRAYRAVRFDPDNACAGCVQCHVYFTHRPLEWTLFVDEHFGAGKWEELRGRALAGTQDWKALALEWIDDEQAPELPTR